MELTKQETNLPSTAIDNSWADDAVDSTDLLIPRILLAQAMSPIVTEKELADAGDMIKSSTEEVMAAKGAALEIVPLMSFKTWRVEVKDGSKWKLHHSEPLTPSNSTRDAYASFTATDDKDGKEKEFRYMRALNFYVIPRTEIKAALTGDSAALPCLIQFKSTSYEAGKRIASGIIEGRMLKSATRPDGMPPFSKFYKLGSIKKTNDLGTFYQFDVTQGTTISAEEQAIASKWFTTIKNSQVKVQESSSDVE